MAFVKCPRLAAFFSNFDYNLAAGGSSYFYQRPGGQVSSTINLVLTFFKTLYCHGGQIVSDLNWRRILSNKIAAGTIAESGSGPLTVIKAWSVPAEVL